MLTDSVAAHEVLDRALRARLDVRAQTQEEAPHNNGERRRRCAAPASALFFHGSGFTGGGEVKLASRAGVALDARRRAAPGRLDRDRPGHAHHARADRRRDARHPLRAASRPPIPTPRACPTAGPTVASRTCMVVGRILQRAAREAARASSATTTTRKSFRKRARRLLAERGTVEVIEEYEKPGDIVWSDETYEGDAYGAYAWGCNIADVEIDPITYQARCTQLHRGHRHRQGHPSHPRRGADRRRHAAGDRLGALRRRGHARRQDAERAAHQLHHPDHARHAAHRRRDRRESVSPAGRSAPRASASARSTGRRRRSSTPSAHATGERLDAIPATPERIMKALATRGA